MRVKATVRYHLISIKMAITKQNQTNKEAENNKCWWGCGETANCPWECEKQHGGSWKTVKWIYHDPAVPLPVYPQENGKQGLTRGICKDTHVHSSIIHNRPQEEATQVAVSRWAGKQNAVCTFSGIFFSLKKENSDMCYNMDEPWEHDSKWNKPVTKGQTLYDPTYIKYLE